ncbi:MAG: carboxyltransferase domain-containing protein, partial [Verrucomicrobiota bacterium]
RVRFQCVGLDEAESLLRDQEAYLSGDAPAEQLVAEKSALLGSPVLDRIERDGDEVETTFRASGDGVILVEFGEMELDLDLRFRAQALYESLEANPFDGLLERVPGIRSLQVQFDPTRIAGESVLADLRERVATLPPVEEMEFPSRIVHLPLSWDDPATREAIEKYTQIVRPDAPWCPSNIEFIRRINGLDSVDEVKKIVYDASYLVMGLGDVYLGAPVATPLDPRHRLVTTKYNPARTWTAENSVGIGGAYLCIYGMEGPGGYQFVGRTLPIWNRFRTTEVFEPGYPWLLRFFDQIRWYPVSAEELLDMREGFLAGQYSIEVEETTFRPGQYRDFLESEATSIASFQKSQRQAFEAERQRWIETGQMNFVAEEVEVPTSEESEIAAGQIAAKSPVAGTLWKCLVDPGTTVGAGDEVAIVESMKMEITVTAPCGGTVSGVLREIGDPVRPGEAVLAIEPS